MKPGYFISIVIIAVYIFHTCDQQGKSTAIQEDKSITITNSIIEPEEETTIPSNGTETSGNQQVAHQQKPGVDKSINVDESSEILTISADPEIDEVDLHASTSQMNKDELPIAETKNL